MSAEEALAKVLEDKADARLSALKAAGYAVIELPERTPPAFPGEFPRFDLGRGGAVIADTTFEVVLFPGWPDMEPDEARAIAAALLAAADAVERAS